MQIKIFNIPIPNSEDANEEMNTFLRSKRILQTESHLINSEQGTYWSFSIKYIEQSAKKIIEKRKKVDYKSILNEKNFERFTALREIRRKVAKEEAIPAYAIFTDEQLAKLARMEEINQKSIQSIEGIGIKKAEKYGQHFYLKP